MKKCRKFCIYFFFFLSSFSHYTLDKNVCIHVTPRSLFQTPNAFQITLSLPSSSQCIYCYSHFLIQSAPHPRSSTNHYLFHYLPLLVPVLPTPCPIPSQSLFQYVPLLVPVISGPRFQPVHFPPLEQDGSEIGQVREGKGEGRHDEEWRSKGGMDPWSGEAVGGGMRGVEEYRGGGEERFKEEGNKGSGA